VLLAIAHQPAAAPVTVETDARVDRPPSARSRLNSRLGR
jgi:hypothetical protein